jgi:HK97 gp10 family phage protein
LATKFKWHGDEFKNKFERHAEQNITKAVIFLTNEVKKEINKAKSPPASSPGEPPHRLKGLLLRSIAWEVDAPNNTGRVGTNLIYGKYLELGTTTMAARPFLHTTLAKNKAQVTKYLTAKMA